MSNRLEQIEKTIGLSEDEIIHIRTEKSAEFHWNGNGWFPLKNPPEISQSECFVDEKSMMFGKPMPHIGAGGGFVCHKCHKLSGGVEESFIVMFEGMYLCSWCAKELETSILTRMHDIIPWYISKTLERQKQGYSNFDKTLCSRLLISVLDAVMKR